MPLQPCDLRDHVTLLRGSVKGLKEAHALAEMLYTESAFCFRGNNTQPEDPFELIKFPLQELQN